MTLLRFPSNWARCPSSACATVTPPPSTDQPTTQPPTNRPGPYGTPFLCLPCPESLAVVLPDAQLVVLPDVGHFPFFEVPGDFAESVLAFISVLDP